MTGLDRVLKKKNEVPNQNCERRNRGKGWLSKCCRTEGGGVLEWRGLVVRKEWLSDLLLGNLKCPWRPLHLFSELSKRTVLLFFLGPALCDLRDHGVGERPSEGMLGTLRPIMGAQQICWYCYVSLVQRDRSSTQEHLCTAGFCGQRPSWHLWVGRRHLHMQPQCFRDLRASSQNHQRPVPQ